MSTDEEAIRAAVRAWHKASEAGDAGAVLDLMTDDALFLTPGRQPMTKGEFAALSSQTQGAARPTLRTSQEIQEVEVSGDIAFMRSHLAIVVTPPGGSEATERRGHTLTIFKRVGGRWLLARDANLLSVVTR